MAQCNFLFFFKALTAVGDSEAVGHLQVVDMRREPKLSRTELNHAYPEGAVLLVRAPRKEPPWTDEKTIPVSLPKTQCASFLAHIFFFTLTDLDAG